MEGYMKLSDRIYYYMPDNKALDQTNEPPLLS